MVTGTNTLHDPADITVLDPGGAAVAVEAFDGSESRVADVVVFTAGALTVVVFFAALAVWLVSLVMLARARHSPAT